MQLNRLLAKRVLRVAVASTAVAFAADALWIPVKAVLAQILLQRAWAETLRGDGQVKPWPWADTWPIARLRAERQGVDLIVLAGSNGHALAFGPGHHTATARPGEVGHSVVSGHRDTHFRFLEYIAPGDVITVQTATGAMRTYRITERRIVHEDEPVPSAAADHALTLVTCYPFGAIVPGGPLRFLVHGESLGDRPGTIARQRAGEQNTARGL